MKFYKICARPYFYFAQLKKENQIPLSPLTSGEQGIFHKEGNLGKPIVPSDFWHDFHSKSPYLGRRCPPQVHLDFS